MDPLHLCIALGPVSVYLLLLGFINLTNKPFLTTGGRDRAALAIAIAGFVVAGPMELFLPTAAAMRFGPYVWALLLALYGLGVTMAVLLMRPRLVIYNLPPSQVRRILANVAVEVDKEARWVGDALAFPNLGVQLTIESFAVMRNTQLTSLGAAQNFAGWRRLEIALATALKETSSGRNPYGLSLLFFGFVMMGIVAVSIVSDQQAVAQALVEMLHR